MNGKMEDPELSYEDIGHLLNAKAEKLVSGEDNPEAVLREIIETASRAESIRSRRKTVDKMGRVSVGRDMTGVHGVILFHPDPDSDESGDDDD